MANYNFRKVTVITGHYGAGKTNVSANIALKLAEKGSVSVVDLDIVNPFFRVSSLVNDKINIVSSKYANSNVDIPALGFDIAGVIKTSDYTIIDVGGDDEGAKALGRYKKVFATLPKQDFAMLYVVNKYRYLTGNVKDAIDLMREIEISAGLKCTGIINNSNLGTETTAEIITSSLPYAQEIAKQAGLPLVFTTGRANIECADVDFPIEVLIKQAWE